MTAKPNAYVGVETYLQCVVREIHEEIGYFVQPDCFEHFDFIVLCGTAAIDFLLQRRDDIPGIVHPGKIGLFGGHREGVTGGILFVRRQLQQVERTIRGDTHERLTAESFEVLKFMASNPQSYPYFYEGKHLAERSEDRVFVLYATELLANYMEHVIHQRPNMSTEDWKVWDRFINDTLTLAPVVRSFLRQRKEWYSAELVAIYERIERQLQITNNGEVEAQSSMPELSVAVIDIGSKEKTGWAIDDTESGKDVEEFVAALAGRLNKGPLALGFEAPMFVPFHQDSNHLTRARIGEGNCPFSAFAGATVLVSGLRRRQRSSSFCRCRRRTAWSDWSRCMKDIVARL